MHISGLTFEQRFWSLRHEVLRSINLIGTIAGLLKATDPSKTDELPEDYVELVERLMKAVEELQEVANEYVPTERKP